MQKVKEINENAETIKQWVELYSDTMYRWALNKTSSKESAEDLVQETFLSAFNSFEKFQEKSSPKTWLFAILNNKISDYRRRNFRQPTTGDIHIFEKMFDHNGKWKPEARPQSWGNEDENLLDNPEFIEILEYCLINLPANWFSAIQLKYLEEKNGDQICQELNITTTNFWQIIHRAKLQLRSCLETNWFKK